MKFLSKVDWWFWVAAALLTAIPLWLLISALRGGEAPWFSFGMITVIDCLLIWPMLLKTAYTFEENGLYIRCGLFLHRRIPYDRILGFGEVRSLLASPALSTDRIRIRCRNRSGSSAVYVSPRDKDGFLEELAVRTEIPNAAPPEGQKALRAIAVIPVAVGAAAVAFIFYVSLTGNISAKFGEMNLTVHASMTRSLTVEYSDINSIDLVENADIGSRLSGIGSPRLRAGTFSSSTYGTYRLYSYTSCPIYIVVVYDGGTMILNLADEAATVTAYANLLEQVPAGSAAEPAS